MLLAFILFQVWLGLAPFTAIYQDTGFISLLLLSLAFFWVAGRLVAAFFVGIIIASIIGQALEFWQTSRYHKLTGHAFTGSEVSFFNAYRLHASRIEVSTDIDLSDSELEEDF